VRPLCITQSDLPIAFVSPQVHDVSTSRERATMKISSIILGKRVETISASASIHDVVNTLNSHHIGALVVSSDGKRIDGIVSERDVVRAMPGKLDQLIGMHVRDIMTVEVHTCTPDTTVAELMKMMTEHRIRHVPVVDAEGALISIVSIGDVVKNRVGEMESENQALRDYVATGA
jgi:CBS domain-containing protein